MSGTVITIEKALQLEQPIFVDMRSPGEYNEAHIPTAVNVPLFSDKEREHIGKVYHSQGQAAARFLGLKYVSPRLPDLVKQLQELAGKGQLVVYCWRGGMRSRSICSVLELLQVPYLRLAGGYKAFRKHVVETLEQPPRQQVVVLRGLTGVGKTGVLKRLRQLGEPAIDIEGLASHRGSVFGHIGLARQPSQKMFENLLFWELHTLRSFPYVLVECESRRTGRVMLPKPFFEAMQLGPQILLYDKLENRTQRLIAEYTEMQLDEEKIQQLTQAILRLKQRLGGKLVRQLVDYLQRGELEAVVESLLTDYYDPLYGYEDHPCDKYDLCVCTQDMNAAVAAIADWCRATYRGE